MASYELKFQLSDGSEVIAGTFTVPAGGGSADVLNLDFQNGKTILTEAEFAKFTNPALVIYGHYIDPNETATGCKVLRMNSSDYDNDTGEATYYFANNGTTLTAACVNDESTGGYQYSITITGGYGAVGTIDFTIDGVSQTADAGMTWQDWCNSVYNTDDFAAADDYISSNGGDTWIVDSNENSVSPSDQIIAGESYTVYVP